MNADFTKSTFGLTAVNFGDKTVVPTDLDTKGSYVQICGLTAWRCFFLGQFRQFSARKIPQRRLLVNRVDCPTVQRNTSCIIGWSWVLCYCCSFFFLCWLVFSVIACGQETILRLKGLFFDTIWNRNNCVCYRIRPARGHREVSRSFSGTPRKKWWVSADKAAKRSL